MLWVVRAGKGAKYYKKFIENKPESSHAPFVENRLFSLKKSRPKQNQFSLVTNPL